VYLSVKSYKSGIFHGYKMKDNYYFTDTKYCILVSRLFKIVA